MRHETNGNNTQRNNSHSSNHIGSYIRHKAIREVTQLATGQTLSNDVAAYVLKLLAEQTVAEASPLPSRLLGEQSAGMYLDVSPRTLQKWRVTGGGPPYVKMGRSVRYRQGDLDSWIVERRVESTSDADTRLRGPRK